MTEPASNKLLKILEDGFLATEDEVAALIARIRQAEADRDAALARVKVMDEALPSVCDGKEQPAFEEWAIKNGYDMREHPLHYLFLDSRTNAARAAWRRAIQYAAQAVRKAAS